MATVPDPRPRRSRPRLHAWVDPAVFDFWATRIHPLWTWERPRARLLARRAEGSEAVTLVLQANRHWRGLEAGQHVELAVEVEGRRLRRHYSPTPLDARRFEITIKPVEGGRVSAYLARQAPIGQVVELGQAYGDMRLPAASAARVLLLAAGSGITPMRALLRDWAARGGSGEVELAYWSRSRQALCHDAEFRALAAAHPTLRLRHWITGEGAPRIDRLPVEEFGELSACHVLACGPGGFVEAARDRLAAQAMQFHAEAFSPAPARAGEAGEVEVTLARSGRRLRLPRTMSLLEGLEAQGLKPRHGCRMGICNRCACERRAGTTRHLPSGERHDEPAASVRLCVNAPSTDLILDL